MTQKLYVQRLPEIEKKKRRQVSPARHGPCCVTMLCLCIHVTRKCSHWPDAPSVSPRALLQPAGLLLRALVVMTCSAALLPPAPLQITHPSSWDTSHQAALVFSVASTISVCNVCIHVHFMWWFREASKYFPVEEKKIFALTYLETDVSLAQIEIDDVARTVRLRGWENVH